LIKKGSTFRKRKVKGKLDILIITFWNLKEPTHNLENIFFIFLTLSNCFPNNILQIPAIFLLNIFVWY